MGNIIGIRREDKNEWERRTPLVPQDVQYLIKEKGLKVHVQPSKLRVYSDEEYEKAGAILKEDLSECSAIFCVKEVPKHLFLPGKTYIFFSHTIKGQKYNMPMLAKMMDLKCNLIDYEKITDEKGRRLIFFGRYAGLAGMVDTLWALGERLKSEGLHTPFEKISQAYKYHGLENIKSHLKDIAKEIEKEGLPQDIVPFVVGFAGYGNVSRGAQEILDILPVEEITPAELLSLKKNFASPHKIYKIVFKEEDMVKPKGNHPFELFDYYNHPEKYEGVFEKYMPHLTVLINAIYWTEKYPRLFTKEFAKKMWQSGNKKLKVIGDISCDIEGAIEMTVKATDIGNPVYVYNPLNSNVSDGVLGEGFVIMAVDNLPCELPRESSDQFSHILKNYVYEIAHCDFEKPYEELSLSPEIKRALILHKGNLTPDFKYIKQFMES